MHECKHVFENPKPQIWIKMWSCSHMPQLYSAVHLTLKKGLNSPIRTWGGRTSTVQAFMSCVVILFPRFDWAVNLPLAQCLDVLGDHLWTHWSDSQKFLIRAESHVWKFSGELQIVNSRLPPRIYLYLYTLQCLSILFFLSCNYRVYVQNLASPKLLLRGLQVIIFTRLITRMTNK